VKVPKRFACKNSPSLSAGFSCCVAALLCSAPLFDSTNLDVRNEGVGFYFITLLHGEMGVSSVCNLVSGTVVHDKCVDGVLVGF